MNLVDKQTGLKAYTVGTECFCDFHFGGRPKGKVVEVTIPGTGKDTSGRVVVELTETVGAYKKGERRTVPAWQAVPCKQEIRSGIYRRVNTQFEYK